MTEYVRIHNIVKKTNVLGPGNRAAIWFQGCMRNCIGCMSPSSRPLNGGRNIRTDSLIKLILSIDDIEGITISGGEPFVQYDALYDILKSVKEKSNLSVIVYSGYTLKQLQDLNNPKINKILSEMIDILIDGEYIDELNDGVALKGSSNQVVHFLSERYVGWEKEYKSKNRKIEVLLTEKDALLIGIPEKETLSTWVNTIPLLNNNEQTDHYVN